MVPEPTRQVAQAGASAAPAGRVAHEVSRTGRAAPAARTAATDGTQRRRQRADQPQQQNLHRQLQGTSKVSKHITNFFYSTLSNSFTHFSFFSIIF